MTVEWLSDGDRPVPLAIVGEADEISYREGGENATQDSPVVRVYMAGREACAGTCEVARERAHRRFIGATSSHCLAKKRPRVLRKLAL